MTKPAVARPPKGEHGLWQCTCGVAFKACTCWSRHAKGRYKPVVVPDGCTKCDADQMFQIRHLLTTFNEWLDESEVDVILRFRTARTERPLTLREYKTLNRLWERFTSGKHLGRGRMGEVTQSRRGICIDPATIERD